MRKSGESEDREMGERIGDMYTILYMFFLYVNFFAIFFTCSDVMSHKR